MTVLPDGRIGTAIVLPDGTVDRTLEIPDETLNAVCTVWSPDDSRLACEAWDDTDPSRGGITQSWHRTGAISSQSPSPKGLMICPGTFRRTGPSSCSSAQQMRPLLRS